MVKRVRATSTASVDTTYSDTYDDCAVMTSPTAKRRSVHSSNGTASSASDGSVEIAYSSAKAVKSEQRKLRNRESAQASRDRKKAEREELGLLLAQAEQRVHQLEQENTKLRADAALREAHQSTRTVELEQQLRAFEDRFKALESLLSTSQSSAPPQSPLLKAASSSLANLDSQASSTIQQSTVLAGSEAHATAISHVFPTDAGLDFLAYDFSSNISQDPASSQPIDTVQQTPLLYPEAHSSTGSSIAQSTTSSGQASQSYLASFNEIDESQTTVDEFLAHFAKSSLQRPFVDRNNSWSVEISQDYPAQGIDSALASEHVFGGINIDDFLVSTSEPLPWLNSALGNAVLA